MTSWNKNSGEKVRQDLLSLEDDEGALGFDFPWSLSWYLTINGSEYFHIYLWIAKDLAWTQEWRIFSLTFGVLALVWYVVPVYHSIRTQNLEEVWNVIGNFLWLFANFWWMTGEAHDVHYPDNPPLATIRTQQSGHVLEAALIWLAIYYLIVIPFGLVPVSDRALREYDDGEFQPRFAYFRNFRQYENIHTLFWLAKDLAWNKDNKSLWFLFLAPTIAVSSDYFIIALNGKSTAVDLAHYAAIVIWVIGNIVWALGEFFYAKYDDPIHLFQKSHESLLTARWYSSWILLSAYMPIVIMYSVWIPLTLSGKWSSLTSDIRIFGTLNPKSYGSSLVTLSRDINNRSIGTIDEYDRYLRDVGEKDLFIERSSFPI